MSKFIFVTGGVVSSLGKGLASAAIGNLLESRGLKITFLKLDPYINVDPGTMNPYQHGEVYVTEDGAETDLDLGHYERYTSMTLTRENNYTTGRIYHSVITKERRGDYLGGTVQVVPHVTDEIKQCIMRISQGIDVTIVEIGGTVGDIESLPFLEAIRQIPYDVGRDNVLYVHLTLVPVHRSGRRTENEADATFGEQAARNRHSAEHSALPHRSISAPGTQGEDRDVLQRGKRCRHYGQRR